MEVRRRSGQQPPGPAVGGSGGSPCGQQTSLKPWQSPQLSPVPSELRGDRTRITEMCFVGLGSLKKPCCAGVILMGCCSSRAHFQTHWAMAEEPILARFLTSHPPTNLQIKKQTCTHYMGPHFLHD